MKYFFRYYAITLFLYVTEHAFMTIGNSTRTAPWEIDTAIAASLFAGLIMLVGFLAGRESVKEAA